MNCKRQLAEIQTKIEELEKNPQFERVEKGKDYFAIDYTNTKLGLTVLKWKECNDECDDGFYNNNNHFHTEERAEEVAKGVRVLLKLWRLHDTLCEDYKPNWKDEEPKWFVFYSYQGEEWCKDWWTCSSYNLPCFSTVELAQKACDILNEEGFKP